MDKTLKSTSAQIWRYAVLCSIQIYIIYVRGQTQQ